MSIRDLVSYLRLAIWKFYTLLGPNLGGQFLKHHIEEGNSTYLSLDNWHLEDPLLLECGPWISNDSQRYECKCLISSQWRKLKLAANKFEALVHIHGKFFEIVKVEGSIYKSSENHDPSIHENSCVYLLPGNDLYMNGLGWVFRLSPLQYFYARDINFKGEQKMLQGLVSSWMGICTRTEGSNLSFSGYQLKIQ
nr:hypothetical protein CFP56_49626 [Quercus suber]